MKIFLTLRFWILNILFICAPIKNVLTPIRNVMLNLFQWTMILTLKQLRLVAWRGVCLIVYEDIINVKNVPKLMRSLISLGVLDTLGYDFFLYRMELWILIKVSQNLQNLPVESHLEKSYVNAKKLSQYKSMVRCWHQMKSIRRRWLRLHFQLRILVDTRMRLIAKIMKL